MLRHLTTEQRATGLAAPIGNTRDQVVDLVRNDFADRDVVKEEERLRTLHRDVVDRHRDEIDADGAPPVREPGDDRLGPHAVGRRHEQRLPVLLPVEREQTAEPADVADDLPAERGAHVLLDALDRELAGCDVDSGNRVRERRGRVGGSRHARTAVDRQPLPTVPATWIVLAGSSASFVSYSGTGTG